MPSRPLPPMKIYADYPEGIRAVLLLRYEVRSGKVDYMRDVVPYHEESNRIFSAIVKRNLTGRELEKVGRIDEAINLYEQNIAVLAETPHPYNRLRIIYTKQKKYDDAIRACRAYIEMSKQLAAAVLKEVGDARLSQQLGNATDFVEHIEKLEAKKGIPNATAPQTVADNRSAQIPAPSHETQPKNLPPFYKRPIFLIPALLITLACIACLGIMVLASILQN